MPLNQHLKKKANYTFLHLNVFIGIHFASELTRRTKKIGIIALQLTLLLKLFLLPSFNIPIL
jgi:hypothetical protein